MMLCLWSNQLTWLFWYNSRVLSPNNRNPPFSSGFKVEHHNQQLCCIQTINDKRKSCSKKMLFWGKDVFFLPTSFLYLFPFPSALIFISSTLCLSLISLHTSCLSPSWSSHSVIQHPPLLLAIYMAANYTHNGISWICANDMRLS